MTARPITIACLIYAATALSAPIPVTVDAEHGMTRDGKPYFVKGAGGDTHLDLLAARGANSLRTWSTKDLDKTLAEAEKLGLTVSAGIWLEPECSWFSYRDPLHCMKQAERVKQDVLKFRDHPALLAWGLGNEMEGDGSNTAYWQQLDQLAVMIKTLDATHPTFTAVAGMSQAKAAGMNQHAPHLDYVGVNTYGGLFKLRQHLDEMGWKRPWMVTEWGPQGFWERPKHSSGAPLEQTSTEKAAMMARGYDQVIAKGGACLGSYAFVWSSKHEATATWFGLLTPEGETTESVDVLEQRWRGHAPKNHAPQSTPIQGLPNESVSAGTPLEVHLTASDADGDPLTWRWQVLPELALHDAKGRALAPKPIEGAVHPLSAGKALVTAPKAPGVYRLYVWITDGQGHAATANAPFAVK